MAEGSARRRRDLLSENTRSGAVDGACEFTQQMLPALQNALKHPDMTEELAEVLSTSVVNIEYEIGNGHHCRLSNELHPWAALGCIRFATRCIGAGYGL